MEPVVNVPTIFSVSLLIAALPEPFLTNRIVPSLYPSARDMPTFFSDHESHESHPPHVLYQTLHSGSFQPETFDDFLFPAIGEPPVPSLQRALFRFCCENLLFTQPSPSRVEILCFFPFPPPEPRLSAGT